MAEHARLSPSGLKHLNPATGGCPGRLCMVERLPPEERNTETPATIDGTRRHELLYRKCIGEPVTYADAWDERLVETAWPYFRDHPARQHAGELGLWLPEHRVEIGLHLGLPEGTFWGTADVVAAYRDTLEIIDAKFGRWEVPPDDPQLKAYAFGAARLLLQDDGNWLPAHRQTRSVKLTIVQPQSPQMVRSTGALPIIETLKSWKGELETIATAALDPAAPLVPTQDNCRFCPAKRICPAYTEKAQRDVTAMFQPLSPPIQEPETATETETVTTAPAMLEILEAKTTATPETLPADELGRVLDLAPMVQAWFEECRRVAEKRLKAGEPVEGWKLIEGRGAREWVGSEREVAAELKRLGAKVGEIYTKKLVSPAQAERLATFTASRAKMEKLHPLIRRKAGKPTLAPESDPSPGVDPLHGMFEDVSQPEAAAAPEPEPETPDWF